jgi:queuine tRNA-ribosyltransferase
MKFELLGKDSRTRARRGRLHLAHGVVETPVFMPVGTQATVKGMTTEQLQQLSVQILLCNSYHLMLRPGSDTVARLGGLHGFMKWDRPILTDSGGYQVFSLNKFRKVTDEGVTFQSHLDGTAYELTPENSMDLQVALGADIIMALDDCLAYPAAPEAAALSMRRSMDWARRCKTRFQEISPDGRSLLGIVQGGVYPDLRIESAERLIEIGFPGYAIGGLAVGEPNAVMYDVIEHLEPHLPEEKPRYLMGVGTPEDLVECVARGIDMFDCVMPTRHARNGWLFTADGHIVIKHAEYKDDERPVDERCGCSVCRTHSRAYLRHLFMAGEILSSVLNTVHNLYFYLDTMNRIRQFIEFRRFDELLAQVRNKDK